MTSALTTPEAPSVIAVRSGSGPAGYSETHVQNGRSARYGKLLDNLDNTNIFERGICTLSAARSSLHVTCKSPERQLLRKYLTVKPAIRKLVYGVCSVLPSLLNTTFQKHGFYPKLPVYTQRLFTRIFCNKRKQRDITTAVLHTFVCVCVCEFGFKKKDLDVKSSTLLYPSERQRLGASQKLLFFLSLSDGSSRRWARLQKTRVN